MGYLKTAGPPVPFAVLQKIKEYVKKHGVLQFITLFQRFRNKLIPAVDSHKWGDETEHHLVYFDQTTHEAKLMVNAGEFIAPFNESKGNVITHLQPEYGAWMLEAIPAEPFSELDMATLAPLDGHFRRRRIAISQFLAPFGQFSLSNVSSYPLLGVGDYAIAMPQLHEELAKLSPPASPGPVAEEAKAKLQAPEGEKHLSLTTADNLYSTSLFTFDAAINSHPRFPTLSQHIRERRGEKVCIKVPLFMDSATVIPAHPTPEEPFPGFVYMDSMAFGMGCCCLQLTYLAQCMDHARYLHDQLLPLAPILAALSASAPIFRGRLTDADLRFNAIAQSVDDRTAEERNPASPHFISRSRYSHNDHYVSRHASVMSHHNDAPTLKVNPEHVSMLREAGADERLAYHIAALFVRDPLVVFQEGIELDDQAVTAHFENLQSTNWNSLRFKPPPGVNSDIGWRVEFRPMDIQLTDYENGALSALVGLLVKLLTKFDVNFMIPISLGDENMERAHTRDAIHRVKFYFRKNIVDEADYSKNALEKTGFLASSLERPPTKEEVEEMTLAEILTGKPVSGYKGIFPLLEEIISAEPGSEANKEKVRDYLRFLEGRARGVYRTGAKYIRDFVAAHPDYKRDSVVSSRINYDLLRHLDDMNASGIHPAAIYAAVPTSPKLEEDEAKSEVEASFRRDSIEFPIYSMTCCQ